MGVPYTTHDGNIVYAAVLNMNPCKQSALRMKLSYSPALNFLVLADKKKTAQAKDSAA